METIVIEILQPAQTHDISVVGPERLNMGVREDGLNKTSGCLAVKLFINEPLHLYISLQNRALRKAKVVTGNVNCWLNICMEMV